MTITAVLLGANHSHALALARNIITICDGYMTTLVDDKRVFCSLQYDEPDIRDICGENAMMKRILSEIKIRDIFEKKLVSLGCPFTFIEDSDTNKEITLEDMKACDGANELLVRLYEVESLRSVLALYKETFNYAEAIDALLPYVKKSIFSKDNR